MAKFTPRQNLAFICQVSLGPEKAALYRAEAEDVDLSLGDYIKLLVEQNMPLILGEDMLE